MTSNDTFIKLANFFIDIAKAMALGGRFEDATEAYKDDEMKHKWKKPLSIWNEKVGTSRNTKIY